MLVPAPSWQTFGQSNSSVLSVCLIEHLEYFSLFREMKLEILENFSRVHAFFVS